jgi:prefoldin subunit 5
MQGDKTDLRANLLVGGGVTMEAMIPDASSMFVDVGLGFSVECCLEDALRIAKMRQAAAQVHLTVITFMQGSSL